MSQVIDAIATYLLITLLSQSYKTSLSTWLIDFWQMVIGNRFFYWMI
ncbi:MAG: hypothetical protein RMX68_009220 [Aulosira sp. ZfuVER01]|nr:hypothetical protein [Aulosira sp. ZfuVER01]MDZ7998817.1 hypothetical protein [Aulosira sp. DedVER01a]MDZ8055836.1 hypothetical protein [Aulosira sp. ZfuCHP01]